MIYKLTNNKRRQEVVESIEPSPIKVVHRRSDLENSEVREITSPKQEEERFVYKVFEVMQESNYKNLTKNETMDFINDYLEKAKLAVDAFALKGMSVDVQDMFGFIVEKASLSDDKDLTIFNMVLKNSIGQMVGEQISAERQDILAEAKIYQENQKQSQNTAA